MPASPAHLTLLLWCIDACAVALSPLRCHRRLRNPNPRVAAHWQQLATATHASKLLLSVYATPHTCCAVLHSLLQLWAPCAATNASKTQTSGWVRMGNSSLEWLRPVGWRVLSTLWVKDGPAQAGVTWPFATVLLKGKQLVILIRGTETYADWLTGGWLALHLQLIFITTS